MIDKQLVGYWRICGSDMVRDKTVTLIAGLDGDVVQFAASGKYIVWSGPGRPLEYLCSTSIVAKALALDVWIKGLEGLVTRCIYKIEDEKLTICIAGNERARPTALKRRDSRLWCLMTLERCAAPKKKRLRKVKPILEPGSFVPKELFGVSTKKNRKR